MNIYLLEEGKINREYIQIVDCKAYFTMRMLFMMVMIVFMIMMMI